jgi:hypothetical protein
MDAKWEKLVGANVKRLIDEYVKFGRLDSYFIKMVLHNDFIGAITSADEESLRRIAHIAKYIYCEIPSKCHGSKTAVENWIKASRTREEKKPEGA